MKYKKCEQFNNFYCSISYLSHVFDISCYVSYIIFWASVSVSETIFQISIFIRFAERPYVRKFETIFLKYATQCDREQSPVNIREYKFSAWTFGEEPEMKRCISFPMFVPSTRCSVLNGTVLGAKSFGITYNFVRLAQFHATRGRQRAILARYLAMPDAWETNKAVWRRVATRKRAATPEGGNLEFAATVAGYCSYNIWLSRNGRIPSGRAARNYTCRPRLIMCEMKFLDTECDNWERFRYSFREIDCESSPRFPFMTLWD